MATTFQDCHQYACTIRVLSNTIIELADLNGLGVVVHVLKDTGIGYGYVALQLAIYLMFFTAPA